MHLVSRGLLWLPLAFLTSATRLIESTSLNPCMSDSALVARYFHAAFTPNNNTLTFEIDGDSQVNSNVTVQAEVWVYGYPLMKEKLNPCDNPGLKGICPMRAGPLPALKSNFILSKEDANRIPGIAYYVPDIDCVVRVWVNSTDTGKPLACLETSLTNGKSVHHVAVPWTIAILTLGCLLLAATLFEKGFSFASSQVVARVVCLFNYYHALALVGMSAVHIPPIVRGWTQNFQWSMGIIRVGFLQSFNTWYQRATGGTPTQILSSLSHTSVRILKRSNAEAYRGSDMRVQTVQGIERVSFIEKIEPSNFFMTGYTWFIIAIMFLVGSFVLVKCTCDRVYKSKGTQPLYACSSCWKDFVKGMLFRLVLICFTPLVLLSSWELFRRDSVAQIILAIFTLINIIILLGLATYKVLRIARQSLVEFGNPAKLLYSDAHILSKWGFLFTQYRAPSVYFLIPSLAYMLVKSVFIGAGQSSIIAQAVSVFVLDLIYACGISFVRPFLDRPTNIIAIIIAWVNFFNAILMLFFSNIFNLPPLAIGICGVLFFIVNLIFLGIVMFMTLWHCIFRILSKNPDQGNRGLLDDRDSFSRSYRVSTIDELAALAETARGDTPSIAPNARDSDYMEGPGAEKHHNTSR